MSTSIKYLLFFLSLFTSVLQALGQEKKVFVMEIRNDIDPRMSRYVKLALEEATQKSADIIIIDMDTYGGAVDDADKIRTMLLNYPKPIHVFINDNAASAGALISIAADSIYMAPGANIGAATVVFGDGQPAPDKYQAYMRSKMRATAERQGRDPDIAEQMVGKPVGADSVTVGDVLSLTAKEAIKADYAEGIVTSIEEILKDLGIKNYQIIHYEQSSIEKVISIFLNPVVQSILLLVMIGGLYFELQTPGVGFPIMASLVAAVFYFLPSYLTGLAQYWEIGLFLIGIILLIVELVILPGFGVAGILGIACMAGALILMMIDNDWFDFRFVPAEEIARAIIVFVAGVGGAIIVMFAGGTRFMESSYFKRIALDTKMDAKEGYTSNFHLEDLTGKTGTAYTVLRPSGKIMIEGAVLDATTRGEYIERGANIVVIGLSGGTLKVKEAV